MDNYRLQRLRPRGGCLQPGRAAAWRRLCPLSLSAHLYVWTEPEPITLKTVKNETLSILEILSREGDDDNEGDFDIEEIHKIFEPQEIKHKGLLKDSMFFLQLYRSKKISNI